MPQWDRPDWSSSAAFPLFPYATAARLVIIYVAGYWLSLEFPVAITLAQFFSIQYGRLIRTHVSLCPFLCVGWASCPLAPPPLRDRAPCLWRPVSIRRRHWMEHRCRRTIVDGIVGLPVWDTVPRLVSLLAVVSRFTKSEAEGDWRAVLGGLRQWQSTEP